MASQGDEHTFLMAFLHNMGYVDEGRAADVREISEALAMDVNKAIEILRALESDGYVASVRRDSREERFYLTGKGVIRVCSIYT